MTKQKGTWDDIPSIGGLEVEWDYEPENPLGKREQVRIGNKDLQSLLGVGRIQVKVAAKNFEGKGLLTDIAQGGIGVFLASKLSEKQPVKIGLFLGKRKLIARAIVRNVTELQGKFRTGMELVDLPKDLEAFIGGLISSKSYAGAP